MLLAEGLWCWTAKTGTNPEPTKGENKGHGVYSLETVHLRQRSLAKVKCLTRGPQPRQRPKTQSNPPPHCRPIGIASMSNSNIKAGETTAWDPESPEGASKAGPQCQTHNTLISPMPKLTI